MRLAPKSTLTLWKLSHPRQCMPRLSSEAHNHWYNNTRRILLPLSHLNMSSLVHSQPIFPLNNRGGSVPRGATAPHLTSLLTRAPAMSHVNSYVWLYGMNEWVCICVSGWVNE